MLARCSSVKLAMPPGGIEIGMPNVLDALPPEPKPVAPGPAGVPWEGADAFNVGIAGDETGGCDIPVPSFCCAIDVFTPPGPLVGGC